MRRSYHRGSPAERLALYTAKSDGCWLWTSYTGTDGYGRIKVGQKILRVHRLAYEFAYGEVPPGLFVLHRCDVRLCLRPDHLFVGTQADNIADMLAKGRGATGDRNGSRTHPERMVRGKGFFKSRGLTMRGEQHHRAKLTQQNVIAIRERYAAGGVSQMMLAREFGVAQGQIWGIIHRRKWAHVT